MINTNIKFYSLIIALAGFFISAVAYFDQNILERHTASSQLKVQQELDRVASQLTFNLYNNIQVVRGLPALFSINPSISQESFSIAAKGLIGEHPQLRNIGAAPGLVIKYIYPLKGNEEALNLDYRSLPFQLEAVLKAKKLNKLILAGPVKLVQGGEGLVSRVPVFSKDGKGNETFWGVVSAVIDVESLYEESGLLDVNLPIEIAIRGKDGLGEMGAVFFGSPELFIEPNAETFIQLPEGDWQLVAKPKGKWAYVPSNISQKRFYLVGTASALFLFFLIFIKGLRKTASANERFNTAFAQAPIGIAVIDSITGDIYDANPAYAKITGRSIEQLRTLDWMGITHPDDIESGLVSIARMNTGETSGFTQEKRYIRPDKSIRWINMTVSPIKVDDANGPRHLCLTEDITQKKETEFELERSKDVLRVLAEGGAGENDNIFELIVRKLADSQGSRYALIAQIDPNDSSQINTRAVWSGDTVGDNFSYGLEGTPCQSIMNGGTFFYPNEIQHHFPNDQILKDMHAEGYLGLPLKDETGRILGVIALIDDKPMSDNAHTLNLLGSLSTRVSMELVREEFNQKLLLSSRVFSETHEGIIIADANRLIVDVNPAFCTITGYSREDVIGKSPSLLNSDKQSPEFYQSMWQQLNEKGHWQGEVWNRRKNNELYAERLSASVLKGVDDKVTHYVGVFTDITDSKHQQEQLSLMAHYDVLTGLPNRALFTDRFAQAIAHSNRTDNQLAVCFLDLDDFKPINDSYGHEVGDQLLIEVAKRISSNIREEDTVSRQGGDEFALLLSDIESVKQCEETLRRVHQGLSKPYLIDGHTLFITASSGVTLYPLDGGDVDTLLRHADQAMYQGKLAGKNRYHLFDIEHDQHTIRKHHRLDEIEAALINKEFQLYYQPKVNMVTGEVFGVEALIRWLQPGKGIVPPMEFLPVIQGTELEVKVGDWVINEALTQLEQWQRKGIQLEVSVNIASHHLQSEEFHYKLEKLLAEHQSVAPKDLQLEILESSALGDLSAISRIMDTCQGGLGVQFALDDFGTGYSSLTHLRGLPADTIKIDQSFVRDLLDDPSDYAITNGVIGLAYSFNRKVIAEGVETTNHGLMLLIMGCEEAQGYGIAKPMPASDFPQWLERYTPNKQWLDYGNKYRTAKLKRLTLFDLVAAHWKDRFIRNIQSTPADVEHWPIMYTGHCPCGTWVKLAREEQLFESEDIDRLSETHEAFHAIADSLLLQYQDGVIDTARKGVPELQTAYEKMNNVLWNV